MAFFFRAGGILERGHKEHLKEAEKPDSASRLVKSKCGIDK